MLKSCHRSAKQLTADGFVPGQRSASLKKDRVPFVLQAQSAAWQLIDRDALLEVVGSRMQPTGGYGCSERHRPGISTTQVAMQTSSQAPGRL